MTVRRILAIVSAVVMTTLYDVRSPAAAFVPPKPGLGCAHSGLSLGMNLPMSSAARDTDIVNILGVDTPEGGTLNAAWIYVNRSAKLFLEVRKGRNADAARVLSEAGAVRMAQVARQMGFLAFVPIPPEEGRGLIPYLRSHHELLECFGSPLP
jgi:hypothetical protein